ncbi:ribosome maturation factor RimM [Clostridioides mangenotii]|uniref:ribosome maturation factor RimM n=1 Tax=Metaclostridioides mangenotii TaxID=1540 RepID=UPI001C0FE839|nr:ribosome maturation factor RimM [Clostridioides mangenotii]MBU5306581.1 ribosome maturation factor RimM [Clostridioides mangenotii]MCR1953751.1 ribosome maturation factor RimM [Clostridioides mangenotii]
MDEKLALFKIGQIVNTQGLKGEVRVYPLTNDINRFDNLDKFYLDKDLKAELEVERVRYKGKMVVMKIKTINHIEEAEKLRNKFIYVGRDNTRDLEEDEFFIADMIGLEVFTVAGVHVGVLKDVLQYSANDVYVVQGDSKEYLIPSILKFVPEINMEERKMIIDPIKGMID